jgi:thiamine transporter ThiT
MILFRYLEQKDPIWSNWLGNFQHQVSTIVYFGSVIPKGGGKIKSDINRNVVWEIAEIVGMQCVTQIAIDETWSAMRCRPKERVGK